MVLGAVCGDGDAAVTALPINSDAEWRQHRRRHVGGSEVAALFGEHPHLTKFELWHRKAGSLPDPDLTDNERVFWGQTLEPAIAMGVAKVTGWNIRKVRRYIAHPTVPGFGGSLDYEVVAHDLCDAPLSDQAEPPTPREHTSEQVAP